MQGVCKNKYPSPDEKSLCIPVRRDTISDRKLRTRKQCLPEKAGLLACNGFFRPSRLGSGRNGSNLCMLLTVARQLVICTRFPFNTPIGVTFPVGKKQERTYRLESKAIFVVFVFSLLLNGWKGIAGGGLRFIYPALMIHSPAQEQPADNNERCGYACKIQQGKGNDHHNYMQPVKRH